MSDPTIFNSTDQVPVTDVVSSIVTPTVPSIPPELAELVGVGKKYQTVEAAIAALPHAQSHIGQLEAELADLRSKVAAQKTTQELLDELKSGIPSGVTPPSQELNQDALAKVVEQVLTQKESKKTADSNQSSVVNTFRETFGDQAEAHYNKVAAEAGLTIPMLNQLARTSPLAVIKLAGILNKPAALPGKIKSDVNPLSLTPSTGEQSAKVAKTGTTRDVLNAWKIAGEKVQKQLG